MGQIMQHFGSFVIPIVILLVAIGFTLTVRFAASRYRKVPPGKVGIFYGRDFKWKDGQTRGFLIVTGGGRVQRPIIESYLEVPTTAFQVRIDEQDIPNKDNVKLTVKGVATCKVSDDDAGLMNAIASLLDKLQAEGSNGSRQLEDFVLNILKGHLRSIIGKQDINELLRERDGFNQKVAEESKGELESLGITLKNLVIQDINDTLGYIDALGEQAVAEAKAEASIKVSDAKKKSALTSATNDALIAEAEKERDVRKANAAAETSKAQAISSKALEIATAAEDEKLKVAEAKRDAADREAQITVQQKEAARRTAELEATVVTAAKADQEKRKIDAETDKQTRILAAEAEASVLKATAEAKKDAATLEGQGEAAKEQAILVAKAIGEAAATKETLLAQAEGTKQLADAFAQMNESGRFILILDRLPGLMEKGGDAGAKIAQAVFSSVAAPLGQIDSINIVDMGGGNGQGGLDKMGAIVPQIVFNFLASAKAHGLDVEGMLRKIGLDPTKAAEMLSTHPGSHHGKPPTPEAQAVSAPAPAAAAESEA